MLIRKISTEEEQTLAELTSAYRRSQAKCQLVQTSYIKRINIDACAARNLGLSSSSDVITFDQNWHHLYSTSAGGKDLFNDAQIRVIGRIEPFSMY